MGIISKELLLALTVFSQEIAGVPIGANVVNVLQLGVAAYGLFFFFDLRRLWVLVAILAGIMVISLGIFAVYEYPISQRIVRQAAAVCLIYLGTGSLLLRCSPEKLVNTYVDVCFIAALFGLFQFLMSSRGINILIKVPLRLDSFAFEPSHYAVAIAPCVYYCLRHWDRPGQRNRALVIVSSLVLTLSATAVVVLAVAFALAFFKRRGAIAVVLIAASIPFLMAIPTDIFPEVISSRLVYVIDYVEKGSDSWDTTNLTVLSFSTNFDVMTETIREGRLLGNGFCGHFPAYFRQFDHTIFSRHSWYGINASSAHCLVIRVISEFGVPGAIAMGMTIFWFVANKRADTWSMFFVMAILARAVKLGSWIDYGLPIFLLAVFYVGKQLEVRGKSSRVPQSSGNSLPVQEHLRRS